MKPRIIEFGELGDTLALEVDIMQSDIYALMHSDNKLVNLLTYMMVATFIHCVELSYFDIPDDVTYGEARTLGLSKEFDAYEVMTIANDYIRSHDVDADTVNLLTEVTYKLSKVIGGPNCYD